MTKRLQMSGRQEPLGSIGKKLEVIRAAARHECPVADIGGMLAEIERGYLTDLLRPEASERFSFLLDSGQLGMGRRLEALTKVGRASGT